MTPLDPTALAAAAKAMCESRGLDWDKQADWRTSASGSECEQEGMVNEAAVAIKAYLAALPPVDAAELVERLRELSFGRAKWLSPEAEAMALAADTITRLSREVEEMRGVKP